MLVTPSDPPCISCAHVMCATFHHTRQRLTPSRSTTRYTIPLHHTRQRLRLQANYHGNKDMVVMGAKCYSQLVIGSELSHAWETYVRFRTPNSPLHCIELMSALRLPRCD